MYRPLHTLKLVLPGDSRVTRAADGRQPEEAYTWPCGCRALGHDTEALAVRCCKSHVDLLAQGHIGRVSM